MRKFLRHRLGRLLAPDSLRFQLLARSLFILLAILLLIGGFQYVLMKEFIFTNKVQNIISNVVSTPPQLWQRYSSITKDRGMSRDPSLYFRFPDSALAFISPDGSVSEIRDESFHFTSPTFAPEVYQEAMKKKPDEKNYSIIQDPTEGELLVVMQPLIDRGRVIGLIQVSSKTDTLNQVLAQELWIFGFLALLALLIGWAVFYPVLRKTLNPLNRIVGTMEKINAGNMNERLPENQKQLEIDRLSASFNAMLERLEFSFEAEKEAKEQMRRFVADASHELRTPLTSIHGFLEVLLRGAVSNPEQLDKALRSMHGESVRLNKLVKDLLYLAKLDQKPGIHLQEGQLDAIIREMEPQLQMLAGKRAVELKLTANTKAMFDRDQIKQIILNLFHNAVQHTDPDNGRIHIVVSKRESGAILSVGDNGPGIPPEHLQHLFERFYRVDPSRTRKHGGAGLGLAITKSIVDLHGATMHVESELGQGTKFSVFIPGSCNSDLIVL